MRCLRDFFVESSQGVKVDSKVAISIIKRSVCTFHSNCKLKKYKILIKSITP